jgi:hypothetical protein
MPSPCFNSYARASCGMVQPFLSASALNFLKISTLLSRFASRGIIRERESLLSPIGSPFAKIDVRMPHPKGICCNHRCAKFSEGSQEVSALGTLDVEHKRRVIGLDSIDRRNLKRSAKSGRRNCGKSNECDLALSRRLPSAHERPTTSGPGRSAHAFSSAKALIVSSIGVLELA